MIKFAFINANGEVAGTIHPSEDGMFTDGQVVGEQTMRSFDYDTDDDEVLNNWYWRDGAWVKTKPARPSANHYWENYTWVLNTVALMADMRRLRDQKLGESDWRVMPDSPLTAEQQAPWITYRQALRDVPANNPSITDLSQVTWPTEPS